MLECEDYIVAGAPAPEAGDVRNLAIHHSAFPVGPRRGERRQVDARGAGALAASGRARSCEEQQHLTAIQLDRVAAPALVGTLHLGIVDGQAQPTEVGKIQAEEDRTVGTG